MKFSISKIVITIAAAFGFAAASYSQQDTVYGVKDFSFSYLYSLKTEGRETLRRADINHITAVSFRSNDTILLRNSIGDEMKVSLRFAKEMTVKKGSNTLAGALIGVSAGALIGFFIGSLIDENNESDNPGPWGNFMINFEVGKPIGAVIGALAGGLTGGIIGSNISNDEKLKLDRIKEDCRKREVIKFLLEQE